VREASPRPNQRPAPGKVSGRGFSDARTAAKKVVSKIRQKGYIRMAVVHRTRGFRLVIYTLDHEPAHVHVTGSGQAKINLRRVYP
jgi:hypothetical protein